MSDQDIPFLPATFEFLILFLKAQAEVHLGLIHFGRRALLCCTCL